MKIKLIALVLALFCCFTSNFAFAEQKESNSLTIFYPQNGQTVISKKINVVGQIDPSSKNLYLEATNAKPQEIFFDKDGSFIQECIFLPGRQKLSFIVIAHNNKHEYFSVDFFVGLQINFSIGEKSICKNDFQIDYQMEFFIQNDRTMVPYYFFEEIGCSFQFVIDPNTNDTLAIIIIRKEKTVILKINDVEAFVDQTKKIVDVSATNVGGQIFVPVRFVAENFGCKVDWKESTREVSIKINM